MYPGHWAKLTPDIHRQYLDRFPHRRSRGAVLWPLAHALPPPTGQNRQRHLSFVHCGHPALAACGR